jgi:hypothetical protein
MPFAEKTVTPITLGRSRLLCPLQFLMSDLLKDFSYISPF